MIIIGVKFIPLTPIINHGDFQRNSQTEVYGKGDVDQGRVCLI